MPMMTTRFMVTVEKPRKMGMDLEGKGGKRQCVDAGMAERYLYCSRQVDGEDVAKEKCAALSFVRWASGQRQYWKAVSPPPCVLQVAGERTLRTHA